MKITLVPREPLSPSSHCEVGDSVVVGLEDLGVVENLISERVEPVEGDFDISGRDPFLQKKETQTIHSVSLARSSSTNILTKACLHNMDQGVSLQWSCSTDET